MSFGDCEIHRYVLVILTKSDGLARLSLILDRLSQRGLQGSN